MKKKTELNGLMNWILLGSLMGLLVAGLKILFTWNNAFTNIILLTLALIILMGFILKFFLDYKKMQRTYKSYEVYLENYEMDKYIEAVQVALSKTNRRIYQDIHRMSLSLGYAYLGEYKKAIDELAQIYNSAKMMSDTAVLSIINIINYYIQLDDIKAVKKIEERASKVIAAYENTPKYGVLIELNRLQVALKEKDLDNAQKALTKAELFRNLLKTQYFELDIAKVRYLMACGNNKEARELLEPLVQRKLPPVFEQTVKRMMASLVASDR